MKILNDCFWKNFEQNHSIFCENQICGIIAEPANTWSNVGYLIVAFFIYRSSYTDSRVRGRFFWSTLALFIGSTLFHASATYLGKFLDVSAMFCLSMTILTTSIERNYNIRKQTGVIIFLGGIMVSLIYLYFMKLGLFLFAGQLLTAMFFERKNVRKMWKSLLALSVAFLFWLLDVKRILCDPDNHVLSGHAVWHLLAAVSIWLFFRSYESKDNVL